MRSHTANAVYNARIQEINLRRAYFLPAWCLLALVVPATLGAATDWHAADAQLAGKIAGVTGPGTVTLTVTNRSSLSPGDVDDIRSGLRTALAAAGVQVAEPDQSSATAKVSLSESLQNYVWVAEVEAGNSQPTIVMVTTPRTQPAAPEHAAAPLTIHKALLWTADERILDVSLPSGSPQIMIVLEPERVVILALRGDQWQTQQTIPIPHMRSWPRDLRGRLFPRKDHLFDAYLPGVFCASSSAGPLKLGCRESDDPWPLGFGLNAFFAPARNFFTGALSPGIKTQTTTAPFYSGAALPRDGYTLWTFRSTDGAMHLLDGMSDQTATNWSWGSDIASVRSGCGLGWQVLATSRESGPADSVQALEIADRTPAALSTPTTLGGTITALWADADATSAIAVAQDFETGKYDAYRLSITCSR